MNVQIQLGFDGNQLVLPVKGDKLLFEQAVDVLQSSTEKIRVVLLWDNKDPVSLDLTEALLQCLQYIHSFSFRKTYRTGSAEHQKPNCETLEAEEQELLLDLMLKAASNQGELFPIVLDQLLTLFSALNEKYDILLEFYQRVRSESISSVIPIFKPLFQSNSEVWSIKLSEGKATFLLEALKLYPGEKEIQLKGFSHTEGEVMTFLQCLPHISQLSFAHRTSDVSHQTKFLRMCIAKATEHQNKEEMMNLLTSVCSYETFPIKDHLNSDDYNEDNKYQSDFLLHLYSQVKDLQDEKGLSLLPSLRSIFQVVPLLWVIKLSDRKTSILLEVLKLQSEKKPVKLTDCSHGESEVRSFLPCLPYISELSVVPQLSESGNETRFFMNLVSAAVERDKQTEEKTLELLTTVCKYKGFPLKWKWCDLLLDYYKYQSVRGLSPLPSLQSVFQSGPRVWFTDLSNTKAIILLEVLKLQSDKIKVALTGFPREDNEVRSFLQCLPYISELSFEPQTSEESAETKFLVNLFCEAAEREAQTGEKMLEMLASVYKYKTFPLKEKLCGFFLDLFTLELNEGLNVVPSPHTKSSILRDVFKLKSETEKWSSQHSTNIPELTRFLVNLFCAAAEREQETGEKILEHLASICAYDTFISHSENTDDDDDEFIKDCCDFLLDLSSQVKDCETKTGLSLFPSLQSVFQSAPPVWIINLSERKASILLEVMKLQSEKKPVKLTGCSHGESEVKSFLQCLPYISELRSSWDQDDENYDPDEETRFLVNLFCAAAEREQETGEKMLEHLASICANDTFISNYGDFNDDDEFIKYRDVLLDLSSQVKDCETKTGLSLFPSLQSVFQSAPPVWIINLSKRKASILLEVMKLQSEKKPVKLTSCSHGESEVKSFLQCLPYISQLRSSWDWEDDNYDADEETRFLVNLFCAAAEREHETGEKILEHLASICAYDTFISHSENTDDDEFIKDCCDFLLDLSSQVKDCETKTGLSLFPSLQSVFQSAPPVWIINLSERKASILLEVMKLQSEKKPVKLTDCSHGESEVKSFLQCLPYISELRSCSDWTDDSYDADEETRFLVNLFCAAAEREHETGEKILEHLASICANESFIYNYYYFNDDQFMKYRCDFLLDLSSQVKDCETKTGLSLFPSLQSVFQSAPPVWIINLSERKASILLEVMKLQSEKKPVKLTDCSQGESEVKSFLQCLPYISQLSLDRNLLLSFIHCCAASDNQQEAAPDLLRTLQHSLDLSSSSCVQLPDEDQTEPLSLTAADCRSIATILRHSSRDTQVNLRHCKVEDSGLDLLFPVLDRVCLRTSKTVLVQLLSLLSVNSERDTVRRTMSLCRALGGELDLSHSPLDERLCRALVLMLDHSEGLTKLDLSHCHLTDHLLLQLIAHLHKVQVLDLSHNLLTDVSTDGLVNLISINSSTQTIRVFQNNILNKEPFMNSNFEIL